MEIDRGGVFVYKAGDLIIETCSPIVDRKRPSSGRGRPVSASASEKNSVRTGHDTPTKHARPASSSSIRPRASADNFGGSRSNTDRAHEGPHHRIQVTSPARPTGPQGHIEPIDTGTRLGTGTGTGAGAGAGTGTCTESPSPAGLHFKQQQHRIFVSWDGQESSKANVSALVTCLKKRGYIIYEHAGTGLGSAEGIKIHYPSECAAKSSPTAGFDIRGTSRPPSSSGNRREHADTRGKGESEGIGIAGDAEAEAEAETETEEKWEPPLLESAVGLLPPIKSGVSAKNKDSSATRSAPVPASASASASPSLKEAARSKVCGDVHKLLLTCTAHISCITRDYTFNLNCKKITLFCREIDVRQRLLGTKTQSTQAPEMLYVMIHGTFTTDSAPYHCRGGWLGYLLKSGGWLPAWSKSRIHGAVESIHNTLYLIRNVVRLNPLHVLYIETRGQRGVNPVLKVAV